MKIVYSRSAQKFLDSRNNAERARLKSAVGGLAQHPPIGHIEPMEGYKDGRMRARVGGWRIIFRYGVNNTMEILQVLDIGNRGDVYK